MANTQRGFPYPNPSAPVAQGAADIHALADRADLGNKAIRLSHAQVTPAGGALDFIAWDGVWYEDWNGWDIGWPTFINLNMVGRYRVSLQVNWISQTGGVNASQCAIRKYAAGGVLQDECFGVTPLLNTGIAISTVYATAPNDFIQCLVASGAGAAGGTAICFVAVEYLGPDSVAPGLLPALPEWPPPLYAEWLERRNAETEPAPRK